MQLAIKPYQRNSFPIGALLIRGAGAVTWLREMQQLQLSPETAVVYPVPGLTANSVWGCLVIPMCMPGRNLAGRNELCQQVASNLFISERAMLHPAISPAEIGQLLSPAVHVFHPEFGLAELTEPADWQALLQKPVMSLRMVTRPQESSFIPQRVKSFRVQSVSPEEALMNMEAHAFPERQPLEDKPLTMFEKIRLGIYKTLFSAGGASGGVVTGSGREGKFWSLLDSLLGGVDGKPNKFLERMQRDFENLEERNKTQVDRLMDMLKNNPEGALQYAIPLDENGSARGTNNGLFYLSKRRNDFSLWDFSGSGGGGSVNLGDHYYELQRQYNETAAALIGKKDYHKAAFVYMKLLKDYHKAAETLMSGGYYQEAASIYLKHTTDKKSAALCYEKGNMLNEAIELYKEIEDYEKVANLYTVLGKRPEANIYYGKLAEGYKAKYQFIKAAQVYKEKMNDEPAAQAILLEGWRIGKDSFNCLNNYFAGIRDIKQLGSEIAAVYKTEVTALNRETFLKVLRYEYRKENELAKSIKDIAYEIIATDIATNPAIVSELKEFNINDKELVKDTIRFKLNSKSYR